MPTFVPAGATLRSDLRPTATQVDRATLRGSPFPLSYRWGMHYRTNGGCVSHPRRAHNLAQIIVCYNYHFAELRVRGLPKMAHWHICTFGHLDIGTSVSPLFPLLSYKWGTHYRTDGGCPLSYKWGTLLLCNAEGYKPRGTSVARGAEPPLLDKLA